MILKLIIEITAVLFLILVLLLLIYLRKYIRLLNKEITIMAENMKSFSKLEEMNIELLKYMYEFFEGAKVQEVDTDSIEYPNEEEQ